MAGLALGCLNAWHWVANEDKAMQEDEADDANDLQPLLPASAAGLALGAIFFGGLWWTVRKVASSPWPALWVLVSLAVRMSMALAAFTSSRKAIGAGCWRVSRALPLPASP